MKKIFSRYHFFIILSIFVISTNSAFTATGSAGAVVPNISQNNNTSSTTISNSPTASNTKTKLEKETDDFLRELVEKSDLSMAKEDLLSSSVNENQKPVIRFEAPDLTAEKMNIQKAPKIDRAPTQDKAFIKLFPKSWYTQSQEAYTKSMIDRKVTLKEAIDIAASNNFALISSQKKLEVAKAKITEAKRALLPTLQLQLKYNGGKAGATGTNLGGRLYKGEHKKVNFTQPIFHGGELWFTVKQAEAGLKLSQEEYKKTKGELVSQVASTFYGVVKAEYNAEYQASIYRETEPIYKRALQEKAKGLVSEVDALNVESQYRSVHLSWLASKNDLQNAKLAFYFALRLDPSYELPVDLRLSMAKEKVDFETLLDRALKNNVDIRMKIYSLESAEWALKVFGAKRLPKFDLKGSAGMVGEVFKDDIALEADNHDLDPEKEWFIGVSGSIPFGPNKFTYEQTKHRYGPTALALNGSEDWEHKLTFDFLDNYADFTDERSAEAAYLSARAELDKARFDVETQVRENYYNISKAFIQADSSMARIIHQEKQNEINRYLAGIQDSSWVSYIEGLVSQSENKYALIQSATDYNTSLLNLKIISGDVDAIGL